jgi:energy-coupling factor transport system substrate-specific component
MRALPSSLVYAAIVVVGVAAFLYPFWLPAEALPDQAHRAVAPFLAGGLVFLMVIAVAVELRQQRMNGATVALLGVLAASAGLLRLLDLPGGGSGIFFLVILAGAAFGARFGLLLGMSAMALSALITGGMGPWLPFQMLGLGWVGATAGFVGSATRRLSPRREVAVLAVLGWAWGFAYGAILNLWSWPFTIGEGPLAWNPELGLAETIEHYRAFYFATSFAWDAAGALTNAVLIAVTGVALLRSMRRFADRLDPVVELEDRGRPDPARPPPAALAPDVARLPESVGCAVMADATNTTAPLRGKPVQVRR